MSSLYSCGPAGSHGSTAVKGKAKGKKKHFTVDIHCHMLSDKAHKEVGSLYDPKSDPIWIFSNDLSREVNQKQMAGLIPKLTSIDVRLKDMDKAGIDIQAVSPAPHQYYYWTEPDVGRRAAQASNDDIAEMVAKHPDRFVGIGTVPLQSPELAVKELERMMKKLDFRGVEISTNVGGTELSDPKYRKFFAKAEELGALIFMHPIGTSEGRRMTEHYFANVIGHPVESSLAIGHLIFGGVLDKHPKLKICVAHGGGYLPYYTGRMDHAHSARADCRTCISRKPSSYLKKQVYFDTVVFNRAQLEYLVAQYGREHVLLGTDYPYDMAEVDPVGFIDGAMLSDDEKASVMGGNAARLLKIKKPRKSAR